MEKYYTVNEFSKILGFHPQTIRNSIKEKRIFAFRPGPGEKGRWRIKESELIKLQNLDFETQKKLMEK